MIDTNTNRMSNELVSIDTTATTPPFKYGNIHLMETTYFLNQRLFLAQLEILRSYLLHLQAKLSGDG